MPPSPRVHTVECSEVTSTFKRWLYRPDNRLVRLVVVDGLPGAGKSTLALELGKVAIDLDDFLPREPTDGTTSWIELVIAGGANRAIRSKLRDQTLVVVCGAAATPVVDEIVGELRTAVVRRCYLKRVTRLNDHIIWSDNWRLVEHAAESPAYFRAIYGFHGHSRPWESADIIIERIAK